MTDGHESVLAAGFRLLWRQQRVLWWIFAVNLMCGLFGAMPGFLRLRSALAHNLAGRRLTDGFDLGMFLELVRLPEINIFRSAATSFLFAFVFLAFMLFIMGGVLATYGDDRRLTAGEFFAACGAFFWRFVRLLLLSIVPFVIVGIIYRVLKGVANQVGDRAIADQVGIFMRWGALLVFLLLALAVRLWFDVAQVRTVVQDERWMWRNIWRSLRITCHDLGHLYAMYLLISFLGLITLAVGLMIWAKLPPTAGGAVFLVLELIIFAQVATRLWQLASATAWYKRHAELVPADVVAFTSPAPVEIIETEPGVESVPPDPGPGPR